MTIQKAKLREILAELEQGRRTIRGVITALDHKRSEMDDIAAGIDQLKQDEKITNLFLTIRL